MMRRKPQAVNKKCATETETVRCETKTSRNERVESAEEKTMQR